MLENVYQPPNGGGSLPPIHEGGSSYNLDRTFALGWHGFRNNLGVGFGFAVIMPILLILALVTCIGALAAVPHLAAAYSIFGLLMVRGKTELGEMFRPFKSYGSILGAFLLVFTVTQLAVLIFSGPYYYLTFASVDWSTVMSLPDAERAEAIGKAMQGGPKGGAAVFANLFSFLSYPLSLYVAGRVLLIYPLIVERGLGTMDAIQKSLELTKPYQWHLMLLGLLAGLVAGAGILACCIGIFFSVPFSMALHGAAIYQLLGEDKGEPIPAS
ncbi:MAG: hypothetical protein K8S54_03020 [Spirochaetia bacterium]|nr:hypothetical protein [Spirochaetia bacterium]